MTMYELPYGNTQQLNLDWFIKRWQEFYEEWQTTEAGIDGALDAEVERVEAAMSDLYAARDAAAASATAAAASATSASNDATIAANAATAAAASATLANTKATAAGLSEAAAALSASQAANDATAAATSASQASASASSATDSAQAAATSEQNIESIIEDAIQDATDAAVAEATADAEAAATAAAGSAGDAADSATAAAASATAADSSADDAADSATAAAGSATAAAGSASDAADSATAAAASAASIVVDSAMSDSSTNPVQNKVINGELTELKTAITQTRNLLPQSIISDYAVVIDGSTSVKRIEVDATAGTTSSVITRCGKNLFPKIPSGSANNLSWTTSADGTVTFTGTPSADTLIRIYNQSIPVHIGTYRSAAFFNNKSDSRLSFFGITSLGNWQINLNSINKIDINLSENGNSVITELRLRIPKDFDATGLVIKPMIVFGNEAPETFEEYNGETFNVTLNNGVVAESIPLLDGANSIWASNGDITITTSESVEDYVYEEIGKLDNSFYKYSEDSFGKYLNIYFKSGNYYVNWELLNIPAVASNSNTWQIGAVRALDYNLANAVTIVDNGEFELAFKENGASDYCGGNNHGDENTDTFVLHIDGELASDLSALPTEYTHFDRIDAFEIATVNRCDTPAQDILKHQKIWIFENGKVTVKQTVKFLETLSVDGMLMGMFKAVRSYYPYGIRQGKVAIEDMTTQGFSSPETVSDDAFYFMYGDNATAKIKASTDNPNDASTLWIDSAENNNKLYYGYYGKTSSASPVSVPADTICCAEMTYDVSYSA